MIINNQIWVWMRSLQINHLRSLATIRRNPQHSSNNKCCVDNALYVGNAIPHCSSHCTRQTSTMPRPTFPGWNSDLKGTTSMNYESKEFSSCGKFIGWVSKSQAFRPFRYETPCLQLGPGTAGTLVVKRCKTKLAWTYRQPEDFPLLLLMDLHDVYFYKDNLMEVLADRLNGVFLVWYKILTRTART